MALQGVEALTTAHLPQAHVWSPLPLARVFPSGLKATDLDHISVALQSVEALTTAHLPQAHRLVITATGKDLPIRAEGH